LYIPIGYFISFIPLSILTLIIGDFIYVNDAQHITEDYLGSYVVILMIGLLTGLVRYGMLRPYLPHIGRRVVVTAGSWPMGLLMIATSYRLKWIDPTKIPNRYFF
jgi:hypothetical protein